MWVHPSLSPMSDDRISSDAFGLNCHLLKLSPCKFRRSNLGGDGKNGAHQSSALPCARMEVAWPSTFCLRSDFSSKGKDHNEGVGPQPTRHYSHSGSNRATSNTPEHSWTKSEGPEIGNECRQVRMRVHLTQKGSSQKSKRRGEPASHSVQK